MLDSSSGLPEKDVRKPPRLLEPTDKEASKMEATLSHFFHFCHSSGALFFHLWMVLKQCFNHEIKCLISVPTSRNPMSHANF